MSSDQWWIQDFPEGLLTFTWHNCCGKVHDNEKNGLKGGANPSCHTPVYTTSDNIQNSPNMLNMRRIMELF